MIISVVRPIIRKVAIIAEGYDSIVWYQESGYHCSGYHSIVPVSGKWLSLQRVMIVLSSSQSLLMIIRKNSFTQ